MKTFCYPLAFVFLLNACSQAETGIRAVREDITESVYASGLVKSSEQYQVFSSAAGIVGEVHVKEGDLIPEGALLYTILSDAQRMQAENAELAAEYTGLRNQELKIRDLRLNTDLARRKMQQDSLLLVRQQKLWAEGIGSRLELEQKELSYSQSSAAFESGLLRLKDLEKQLRFNALQSSKNLEISRSIVKDFQVRSIQKGKVYSLFKKKGEMVAPQTPLAVLGDPGQFLIELQVDEFDITRIREGMQVFVTLDSYRDTVFEARISRIYPIMNERSKTFTVEAVFEKKPPLLFPNLSVEANILLQRKQDVLTIPRKYLIGDTAVLKADGSRIRVSTGLRDYKKAEITGGLSPDDELILPAE